VAAVILAAIGVLLYKLVFEREARSAKYSEMTVLADLRHGDDR
jgi:branched-chain amino acid transport system permease protein